MGHRKSQPSFKRQVVERWVRGEKSVAQICREHGLADSLRRRWREQYAERGPDAWDKSQGDDAELQAVRADMY